MINDRFVGVIINLCFSGKDNVVGLELCLRNKDSVAFVMPYFPHDPFSVNSCFIDTLVYQVNWKFLSNLMFVSFLRPM